MVDPDADSLVEALGVRTHAKRGFAAGALLAAALFGFFVLIPGRDIPTPFFVVLGFVLAVSTGLLVTTALTLVAAYRLSGRLPRDDE